MRKVIEVRNLYKLYRVGDEVVRALDGVDFEIYEGEFCAIVGTSGSGKSTLLNMLAGLEKPTKGEVIIAGKHIEKLNEEQLVTFRRDHVGFIFQSFHLMGTLNAVENVALPLSFRGVPRDVRVRKANEMLDLVKLGKHKKHLPNQMSGGQQQRVGVARALVVDPDIIFADAPTGNLDSHTSEEVMELMQRVVREQKKTLVMVTHDDHLATYADRVFHIRDGRIIKIEDNRWKKGKEELTAEEYRQKAQKQIELLKNQWKIFFRTGIIVVAAFIVMIVVSIAWFVRNTRVDAMGVAIRPADMPFDLAAAGIKSDEDADRGIYDKLLTVSPGALREIDGKKYWSTDGSHTSICWAVTPESNMNNTGEDGKPTGIEPGSYGKMTFYIITNRMVRLK